MTSRRTQDRRAADAVISSSEDKQMSRIISYSAWLFSFVLVSLASTGAVHAATETVTLKNGNTYEVEVDRGGEPVGAETVKSK